jgi:polyisoprenyl-phosphate glycosyltransferase
VSSTPAAALQPDCSIVVPVYRNEDNIDELLARLALLHQRVPGGIEAVLVVDGSPDRSYQRLVDGLHALPCRSRLLLLSRNFGSFAAIRAGLAEVATPHMAVMAADLQEPAEWYERCFACLRAGAADLVLGSRSTRDDPWASRLASTLFWGLYRRFVQPALPPGGTDMFACTAAFRDQLLRFNEINTSLVGQLLWLGFRRETIPYHREQRRHGRSAWTLRRKFRYLADSLYAFSDLPIRAFLALGVTGLAASVLLATVVVVARVSGAIAVPGYAATVLTVLFFSALNLFGLGIIGSYVWRAYENTKGRPLAVVMDQRDFPGGGDR